MKFPKLNRITMNKTLIYIIILSALWFLCFFIPNPKAKAQAPEIDFNSLPIQQIIYYYADMYGVDSEVSLAIAKCESKLSQATIGDNGNAKGLYQYWDETWLRHYKQFLKETGIELDKNSPADNARLANWAIGKGHGREWSTFRAIKNGGTYSFYSTSLKKHFTVTCNVK